MPFFLYSDHADPRGMSERMLTRSHAFWRTGDIAANDGFQRDHFSFLHQHSAPVELTLVLPDLFGHLIDVCSYEMVWEDVPQLVEPEKRYFRQDFALVGNTLCSRSAFIFFQCASAMSQIKDALFSVR